MTPIKYETLNWEKGNGLIPAIVQCANTDRVLMLGFMNKESLQKTQKTGLVTFFSRTRNSLWQKGESSGNTLSVRDISIDCDEDTLLISATPAGPICHTGMDTCFGDGSSSNLEFLNQLENLIYQRKNNGDRENSYTSHLFESGPSRIAKKLGEEGVEAALAGAEGDLENLKEESADLIYHLLVMLASRDLTLKDVVSVLESRHK